MSYVINTPCGQIRGSKSHIEGINVFKGIRYAKAERFTYPKEVTSWDGIYDATQFGHCCYQARAFYDESKVAKKAFYYNEFRKGETYTYSEDCLFLDIWVPDGVSDTSNLPVIFYIHGGGFTGGCGFELQFKGPLWPKHDVIAVTINYRLGPLGFTCLKELKEEAGHSGNYGLYDQVAALKWVKRNIKSFGGNPDNITVMGQSAGAMSIQQLCVSPITKGLFHKAIMCSGGGVNPVLITQKEEKQYAFTHKIMEYAGCTTLEEFRALSPGILYEAWEKAKSEIKGMPSTPVIDGELIIDTVGNILKQDKHHHIPYIMGSTSEDMFPPFAHSMSKGWCDKQDVPSYCYMFNHQLPSDNHGAWHSAELWYFFGTLDNCWRDMGEVDYALSEKMIKYLTNFAKTANPNGDGLAAWELSSKKNKKVMHFGNGFVGMQKVNKGILYKNMMFKKQPGQ